MSKEFGHKSLVDVANQLFKNKFGEDMNERQIQILENLIFEKCEEEKIANNYKVKAKTLQNNASRLCRIFSNILNKRVTKKNLKKLLQEQKNMLSNEQKKEWENPTGEVPLSSGFYVERLNVEKESYRLIEKPGALIRIEGNEKTGKTSLISRIKAIAERENNYHTVSVDFRLIDEEKVFSEQEKFKLDLLLKWFCSYLSLSLGLTNQVENSWDDLAGSKVNCNLYLEKHIIQKLDSPVVIALDRIEILFKYPQVAINFFSLIRVWYEKAKNDDEWKKLKVIVAYFKVPTFFNVKSKHSPFNVGEVISLSDFNISEVSDLASRYELKLSENEIKRLLEKLTGHPYLIHQALYNMAIKQLDFDDFIGSDFLRIEPYEKILKILNTNN